MIKKIFLFFFIIIGIINSSEYILANQCCDTPSFRFEHLITTEKATLDLVKVTDDYKIIVKNNIIPVAFCKNFTTKKYKGIDVVEFTIPYDIKTKECSLLIPCGTVVLAEINCLNQPKWFNRSGKVGLTFKKLIFPNGNQIDLCGQVYENNGYLKNSRGLTAGKVLGYTLGGFGLGAGNGAWIGAAASKAWTGTWIGMAIGGGVGLVSGVVSPGLHYKAKEGQIIFVRLMNDLIIPNCSLSPLK